MIESHRSSKTIHYLAFEKAVSIATNRSMFRDNVDDLRERMRLLQHDRRANIDLLETNKVSNENEIRRLKEENEKLRLKMSDLQKRVELHHGSNHFDLKSMKKFVLQKRSEYDAQKASRNKSDTILKKLKDEAKTCRLEEKRPSRGDGPNPKQIDAKIDKAMIQCNEAENLCKTYEHIVQRLKEERISFDKQLAALERTMQSKQRDNDELLLLSGDSNHARDGAQQNLIKAKCSFQDSKACRTREIREKEQQIKIRRQMLHKQERNDAEKIKSLEDENRNKSSSSLTESVPTGPKSARQAAKEQEMLDGYIRDFHKLQNATGFGAVNDMIRKFSEQESRAEKSTSQITQNESRIQELTQMKTSMTQSIGGKSHQSGNSDRMKEMEGLVRNLQSRLSVLEKNKAQRDRQDSAIVNAKAGIGHLREKLSIIPDELNVDNKDSPQNSLAFCIHSIADALVEVQETTREKELDMSLTVQDAKFAQLETWGGGFTGSKLSKKENQRIILPSAKEESAFDYDSGADSLSGDFDGEEEISRDALKRASYRTVEKEERKMLRNIKSENG